MEMKKQAQPKKSESRGLAWSILAAILALRPLPVLIYLGVTSSRLGFSLGLVALLMSYWWVHLLCAIAAITLAIIGLKSKLRWLSIVVLCIEIITVLFLLFFFVFRRDLI